MTKFKHENIELFHGDCIEGIAKIPDGSIDAIVTDPPYFLGLTHNGQKATLSDLNIALPFYKELFREFKRVLAPSGSVYFFCDWRGYAFYYPLFNQFIGADNMLVWDKGSGCGNFYTYEHELIIFGTNNRRPCWKGARNIIREIKSFPSGAKKTNGAKVHPTQKPVELIEKLITDSTQEGATILDTFAGSGTTGIACHNTGRKFIGFEIDEEYYNIAVKRMKEAFKCEE